MLLFFQSHRTNKYIPVYDDVMMGVSERLLKMSKIYKLIVGKGQSHLWEQLPEDKKKSLFDKVNQTFEEVAGERPIYVDSSWSSEEHPWFMIEVFPDVAALQKYTAACNEVSLLRYFDAITIVGTESSFDASTAKPHGETDKAKVYKLVVAKGPSPRWEQVPESERTVLWDKANQRFKEVGGERKLWADSSWSSEEHPGFFVEVYPDIEALLKFTAYLNELKFLQYFDVMTVIGTQLTTE